MIKKCIFFLVMTVVSVTGQGLSSVFEQASARYDIPAAILKSIAFAETRGEHIIIDENFHSSCIGIPHVYGIMGLRDDDWFGHSLQRSAELSGYTIEEIKTSEEINILAAAAYLNWIAAQINISRSNINQWRKVVEVYSGIPQKNIVELYSYEIYRVLHEGYTGSKFSIEQNAAVDLSKFSDKVKPGAGIQYFESEDYGPAVWDPSPNFTNGSINQKFSVVHTTQGGFAGSVSWLKNPVANASSHYIIRSSDGYIVQLVREQNRAWHAVCWNAHMLGVEHEGFVDNPAWYTDAMYIASANLFNHFAVRYNIPVDKNRIVGHNQWQNNTWKTWMSSNFPAIDPTCNTHTDPGIYWDWDFYIQLISRDTTSPQITSYTPASSGDSVWANAPVKIKFNQRMKRAETQTAFMITPAVTGVFLWEDFGKTLVFKPTGLYQLGTEYQVTLDTSAVNYNNRNLLGGISFNFVTRSHAPLNVLTTYPQVNQVNIPTSVRLQLNFDTPLMQNTINTNIRLHDVNDQVVPIKNIQYFEEDGKSRVTFSSLSPLRYGSTYSIRIKEGLTNILGTSLGAEQYVLFTTADSIYVAGLLVDDFELIKNWQDPNYSGSTIGTDPALTTFTIVSDEYYAGSKSGKINYVFTGIGGVCRTFNSDRPNIGSSTSERFGLWIYGDLSGNYLEYWFYYNTSTNAIVKVDTLNWTGWKWVEIPIASIPGSGNRLFHSVVIRQSPAGAATSAIYIDNAIRRDPALTDIDPENISVPMHFALEQNYPNPFNPETKITFTLPSADKVSLSIYDILGNKVSELLANATFEAGSHSVVFSSAAHKLASGIYIYRITSAQGSMSKKMTYLK